MVSTLKNQIARYISILLLFIFEAYTSTAQHSVARQWNEANLQAIRDDFARPTVHARNLFHLSVAMYDAWAAYDDQAETYLLGKEVHGFNCPFEGITQPDDIEAARNEAISYAAFRIITHRYDFSPGRFETFDAIGQLMDDLGYDVSITYTTYQSGTPAHLGNFIAAKVIEYGLQDGSNELQGYRNLFYQPVNDPLVIQFEGNPDLSDFNRWQPLTLEIFIDQSGNPIPGNTPDFLSPEWGAVLPFALKEENLTVFERDGFEYKVYHDPGAPVMLSDDQDDPSSNAYKWGFSMVSIWASHLDPSDAVMIDISPASIGNNSEYPPDFRDYPSFYNYFGGGDAGQGHDINPVTGQPYEPNIVPRADYARVLAEFWADGPDSETPPGHWFTILNTVSDDPLLEKRYMGEGEALNDLEWDVKSYFAMAGAMHDCAVSAWGIKGWYDYIRPVSAIRGLAELGQSTDENLPSYDPRGISLLDGFIELVGEEDPLAGVSLENVGKIKLFTWKGPDFIEEPETDVAGVDWILAGNWWPYQRPSFVTPPFAGYVSGHSTYSRAAAEVLEMLTGDAFFPGGVEEFPVMMNEFLVFEDGPSVDFSLQWATYRDASDQTSLSRIWGGIHPPVDDIPGRLIGEKIGLAAFDLADRYFEGIATSVQEIDQQQILSLSPNPVAKGLLLQLIHNNPSQEITVALMDIMGRKVFSKTIPNSGTNKLEIRIPGGLNAGVYIVVVKSGNKIATRKIEVY